MRQFEYQIISLQEAKENTSHVYAANVFFVDRACNVYTAAEITEEAAFDFDDKDDHLQVFVNWENDHFYSESGIHIPAAYPRINS